MSAVFRRINALTPARGGNENASFQPNIGLKDGLASGRKHNRPKQAFGELKNVLHNHESKNFNNIRKNILNNLETPIKCEPMKKNILKENQYDEFDYFDYATKPKSVKSTEEHWAEKIALTVEDCNRILAPQKWERNNTVTMEEICEIIQRDCDELGDNTLDKLLEAEFEHQFDDIRENDQYKEFNLPNFDDIPEPILPEEWDLDLLL